MDAVRCASPRCVEVCGAGGCGGGVQVCPKQAGRITLQDLVASRCGHTVVSMLIDVNGFLRYDNRETLIHGAADARDMADDEEHDVMAI